MGRKECGSREGKVGDSESTRWSPPVLSADNAQPPLFVLFFRGNEHVSYARDRADVGGILGIGFDFLA